MGTIWVFVHMAMSGQGHFTYVECVRRQSRKMCNASWRRVQDEKLIENVYLCLMVMELKH